MFGNKPQIYGHNPSTPDDDIRNELLNQAETRTFDVFKSISKQDYVGDNNLHSTSKLVQEICEEMSMFIMEYHNKQKGRVS